MDTKAASKTLRVKGWENVQTDNGDNVFAEADMAVEDMAVEVEVNEAITLLTATNVETRRWQVIPLAAGTMPTPTEAEAWVWQRYTTEDFA